MKRLFISLLLLYPIIILATEPNLRHVTFINQDSVVIDKTVNIAQGTVIGCGVQILGTTSIGENSYIGHYSIIINSTLASNVYMHPFSIIENSTIQSEAQIGPFAHISEHAIIEKGAIIGNFVDVKRSTFGEGSKAKHLSYLGDAIIGKHVNIGGGTIICNYNGVEKQQTNIKDNASIGGNNSIVAPVTIEENSMTAAGSTITEKVPQDTLAIARTRQVNKIGYVKKLLERYRENKANKNKK